jgi:hypothetical protein
MPEDIKEGLENDDKLIHAFNIAFRDLEEPHQIILERTWYRNILYMLGEQWLSWLDQAGTFGTRYGLNYGVPTPVSNIIRDYVRSMTALILNKQYTATVWPNSIEQKDKDAAEIGNDVLKWLNTRNESEIEDIKELCVLWMVLTGNGITRTFANVDGDGFVHDAAGKAVSKADVAVDVILPFNFRVSSLGTRLRQKAWVGCKNLCYREWVEDTYKVKLEKAATDMRQIDYQRQLLALIANVSPWKGHSIESSDLLNVDRSDLCIVKEMEFRPTKKHPKGQYAAMVDDTRLIYKDHLPIPVKDGAWYYTFDHFLYNRAPGGFWASGGVDDLISPQNTLNEVDQALAINRKSLGRPYILTPTDLVLKRLSERGQALLMVQYDARTSGGQKAQILPGTPYPQQILDERNIHKETAQEAAGDPKNVLRGKAPYAGAPGVAIDILRETAEAGHGPDVRRFYRTWNRVERKRLILVSTLFKENRLVKVKGQGSEVRIHQFKGADLHGNVDVHLELDSGLSSTNVGKNQFMMQLVQYGFWDPMKGPKPDVRRELLKRFGMAGFPEEENLHQDRAEYENSLIVAGRREDLEDIALPPMPTGQPDPEDPTQELVIIQDDPVFDLDDHFTHVQMHDRLIFSREFKALKEDIQMIAILHRELHKETLAEQMMAEEALKASQDNAASIKEEAAAEGGMESPEGDQGVPGAGGLA